MPTPDRSPIEKQREELLDAILEHVVFDGWTETALHRAQESCGFSDQQVELLAPLGIADLIEAFFDRADDHVRAAYGNVPDDMRIRDRVKLGVMAWLTFLTPHKEAVRRAMSRSSLRPLELDKPFRRTWHLADLIWRETGDTSTDWNHYSKRTILSGVITSTMLAWIASEDISTVEAFLDNRIQNVMQFEKLKAGVSKRFGGRFSR